MSVSLIFNIPAPQLPIWLSFIAAIIIPVAGLIALQWRFLQQTLPNRAAMSLAKKILSSKRIDFFPFYVLQFHIGGFDDDELRQILVGAGGIRAIGPTNEEYWILLEKAETLITEAGDASVLYDVIVPAQTFPSKTRLRHTNGKA